MHEAFLCEHCKEIEENNRMGKKRDLFKKIEDNKGIFLSRMGTIKDRKGKDLTEAETIKKRWQEYTKELFKKGLNDLDNHDGLVTHLARQPGVWSQVGLIRITTNKASGGDGIPLKLFQILKDDAIKVVHSTCQQIWKTAVAIGLEKASFHSIPKEGQCQRMLKLL